MRINLGPGPSYIPNELNKKIYESLFNDTGRGFSMIHQSHRSDEFSNYLNEFKLEIRDFLNIPNTHEILVFQGGATLQFALIANNLKKIKGKPNYVVSGFWSSLAAKNASKIREINDIDIRCQGSLDTSKINIGNESYIHFAMNETVDGINLENIFDSKNLVVCDASSCLFGKKIDYDKFDIVYSSSSKNLALPGFTIVIFKKDVQCEFNDDMPDILNFEHWFENDSIPCTPPTPSIYMCREILKYMARSGDLDFYDQQNKLKATYFYDFIDQSPILKNEIQKEYRSDFNFIIYGKNIDIENSFINYLETNYANVRGHESRGGLRINCYNLLSLDEVKNLITFISKF